MSNNIYTPEFIKLASHPEIQKMIEPEVDTFVSYKADRKISFGIIVQRDGKKLFRVRFLRGACLETDHWFDKQDRGMVLLPTLSWLVRTLDSMGMRFKLFADGFPVKNGTWQCDFYFFDTRSFTIGDTPELACLKALCKIKKVTE